jgi:hypothetical protein
MSKKKQKFGDIWVNQTTLGKKFNLSAVAIGKKLKELGLREANGNPSTKAIEEGFCKATPLKDGTPFFMWNKDKVASLLQSKGLQSLTQQEIRCKELAESLIEANRLSDKGDDKIAYMIEDDVYEQMRPDEIPLINRFLKELGSTQQIEQE